MMLIFGLFLSFAAAVIPTTVYAFLFYFADRHEREPLWLLLITFLWGAVPAIIASLAAELLIGAPLIQTPGSVAEAVVESALVAPLVEEFFKGLALFAIYRLFRNEFDGVLDGLTYGALVGFGFAMTENFLYFVGAFFEGGLGDLTMLVFLRSVVFGLNHAVYSGILGIGLGLARTSRSPSRARFWVGAGFTGAVLAHALHNFGATISAVNGFGIVLSLGLAAVGLANVVLVLLISWRQERVWLRDELRSEVGIVLTPEEYAAILRRPILGGVLARTRADRRLHLLIELGFMKRRLRRLGLQREPHLPAQIDDMRLHLAAENHERSGSGIPLP